MRAPSGSPAKPTADPNPAAAGHAPGLLRTAHGGVDQIEHRRVQAVGLRGQFGMLAIHRQRILGEVVGADGEEIDQWRETVGHHRHGGNLDHDAEFDVRPLDLFARQLAVSAQRFDLTLIWVTIGNMIHSGPCWAARYSARSWP
jgi:hypothetical protein